MIIRCCDCEKIIGEKEPFEDRGFTDTYCAECYKILKEVIAEKKKRQKKK